MVMRNLLLHNRDHNSHWSISWESTERIVSHNFSVYCFEQGIRGLNTYWWAYGCCTEWSMICLAWNILISATWFIENARPCIGYTSTVIIGENSLPSTKVLIEFGWPPKHTLHSCYLWYIPAADVLVEYGWSSKHIIHACDTAYIPPRYVLVKGCCSSKHEAHICNSANVPIRYILFEPHRKVRSWNWNMDTLEMVLTSLKSLFPSKR